MLEGILVKQKKSHFRRRFIAFKIYQDVQQIASDLESYKSTLVFYQTKANSEHMKRYQEIKLAIGDKNEDDQCLRHLRLTDPQADKKGIEQTKDKLLKESFIWILDDTGFKNWRNNDSTRLLWIKGDPGKGKTMLMIGLIEELSKETKQKPESVVLSYFFCQGTSSTDAVSVLRGLIFLLAKEKRNLIRHIRKDYDVSGLELFEDRNAIYTLGDILLDC